MQYCRWEEAMERGSGGGGNEFFGNGGGFGD